MMENGMSRKTSEMAKECRLGQMVPCMKGIGETIKQMVKVD